MIPGTPGIIHLGWPESPLGVRPGLGCHDLGALDSPSVAASRLPLGATESFDLSVARAKNRQSGLSPKCHERANGQCQYCETLAHR